MKYKGLRDWLSIIEQCGELTTLEDVDWNLEMGAVVDVLYREHPPYPPALIFDRIKDHKPAGGFVATETLLERFARDQAYGGEVDPKDPTIRVGSCRVSRQNPPNRWAIRLGRRRRANIAP